MPIFSWIPRAIERDETAGLMKLVVDAETDRILGAAVLASEGGVILRVKSNRGQTKKGTG